MFQNAENPTAPAVPQTGSHHVPHLPLHSIRPRLAGLCARVQLISQESAPLSDRSLADLHDTARLIVEECAEILSDRQRQGRLRL